MTDHRTTALWGGTPAAVGLETKLGEECELLILAEHGRREERADLRRETRRRSKRDIILKDDFDKRREI
tara:strand:+ start:2055 stop:2261 length:207 start_codon:yes stop_codon:yes gene_type:complete